MGGRRLLAAERNGKDLFCWCINYSDGMDKDGTVYLSVMSSQDYALLHGGSVKQATPQVADADDLAVARLPRGASLELNAQGAPARVGDGELGPRRAGRRGRSLQFGDDPAVFVDNPRRDFRATDINADGERH